MAPSYIELEQSLENAYAQVQSMSAIIGVLLERKTNGMIGITRQELENNHDTFVVEVTPQEDAIILTLKAK